MHFGDFYDFQGLKKKMSQSFKIRMEGKKNLKLECVWHQTSDWQEEKLGSHEEIAKIFWVKSIWKHLPGKLSFKYEGKMKIISNMQTI